MSALEILGLFLVSFAIGWSLRSWFAYKEHEALTDTDTEGVEFLPNSSFVYRIEQIGDVFYAYDLANSFIMQDKDSTHIHEAIKQRYPFVEYYLMINEQATKTDEPV